MAKAFGDTKGKAVKTSVDAYKMIDGENSLRMFGGVLPRYMYWVKSSQGTDLPVECLAFNRDKEKFDNLEYDHVPDYFPGAKCQWSYSINCIDLKGGGVKVFNLKKKLFEQIMSLSEDLGDPTDPDTGWDVVFKKVKTGPLPFNVEYTLQQLRCKPRKLTDEEKELIAKDPGIDSKYPRPTADEVKANLEKLTKPSSEDEVPDEAKETAADV